MVLAVPGQADKTTSHVTRTTTLSVSRRATRTWAQGMRRDWQRQEGAQEVPEFMALGGQSWRGDGPMTRLGREQAPPPMYPLTWCAFPRPVQTRCTRSAWRRSCAGRRACLQARRLRRFRPGDPRRYRNERMRGTGMDPLFPLWGRTRRCWPKRWPTAACARIVDPPVLDARFARHHRRGASSSSRMSSAPAVSGSPDRNVRQSCQRILMQGANHATTRRQCAFLNRAGLPVSPLGCCSNRMRSGASGDHPQCLCRSAGCRRSDWARTSTTPRRGRHRDHNWHGLIVDGS